jgi:hypothetical protein
MKRHGFAAAFAPFPNSAAEASGLCGAQTWPGRSLAWPPRPGAKTMIVSTAPRIFPPRRQRAPRAGRMADADGVVGPAEQLCPEIGPRGVDLNRRRRRRTCLFSAQPHEKLMQKVHRLTHN